MFATQITNTSRVAGAHEDALQISPGRLAAVPVVNLPPLGPRAPPGLPPRPDFADLTSAHLAPVPPVPPGGGGSLPVPVGQAPSRPHRPRRGACVFPVTDPTPAPVGCGARCADELCPRASSPPRWEPRALSQPFCSPCRRPPTCRRFARFQTRVSARSRGACPPPSDSSRSAQCHQGPALPSRTAGFCSLHGPAAHRRGHGPHLQPSARPRTPRGCPSSPRGRREQGAEGEEIESVTRIIPHVTEATTLSVVAAS